MEVFLFLVFAFICSRCQNFQHAFKSVTLQLKIALITSTSNCILVYLPLSSTASLSPVESQVIICTSPPTLRLRTHKILNNHQRAERNFVMSITVTKHNKRRMFFCPKLCFLEKLQGANVYVNLVKPIDLI